MKTYTDLVQFDTYEERLAYLKLDGKVGADTCGFDRYLNQILYRSPEWKRLRNQIITRDNGCDLGIPGFHIPGRILIHHINPIRPEDVLTRSDIVFNPEYLITVSHKTHNFIHYTNPSDIPAREVVERKPNDTCPWKRG